MKLILLQEVTGLGAAGDVVEVKDGYGRNYLVPQRLGMLATKGAEKQIVAIRRAREVREVHSLGTARELAGTLSALPVRLRTRAGAGGRLFGSISSSDIVDAVSRAGGPALDRRRVEIANPIKTVGSHTVSVQVHPEVTATITVEVVAT